MPLKNNQRQKLEHRLAAELPNVMEIFVGLTNIKVPLPTIKISNKVKDVELYRADTIFINPMYMPKNERISYSARLAHGFFHHVQYRLFGFYDHKKIRSKMRVKLKGERLADLVNNFVESSAMFFAAVYLTKRLRGKKRTERILAYLNSKSYTPPNGRFFSGNEAVMLAYAKNNYSIKKTLGRILSYTGAAEIMRVSFSRQKMK